MLQVVTSFQNLDIAAHLFPRHERFRQECQVTVTYCFSDNLKNAYNVPLGCARIAALICKRYVRKRKDSRQVRHHCL